MAILRQCMDVDAQIALAIERSERQLNLEEFIKSTGYISEPFMLNEFWCAMKEEMMVYVNDILIRWIGYSAAEAKSRKLTFQKLLPKKVDDRVYYYQLNNEQYATFLAAAAKQPIGYLDGNRGAASIYPPVATGTGSHNIKHLLLSPDCLRDIMMRVDTARGSDIRKYYRDLERVFGMYIRYQSTFASIQLSKQLAVSEQRLIESKEQMVEKERALAEANSLAHRQLSEAREIIVEKDDQLNRLGLRAQEMLKERMAIVREESVYVATTAAYASQYLYKIGRTTNTRARNATHNTSHPIGDEVIIVKNVKTRDSKLLEWILAGVLSNCRPSKDREFYQIEPEILYDIIDTVNDTLSRLEDTANDAVMRMHDLMVSGVNGSIVDAIMQEQEPVASQYRFPALKVTDDQVVEIIDTVLIPDSTMKIGDIHTKIRAMVNPKIAYKRSEWLEFIIEGARQSNTMIMGLRTPK